jgi:excisionase family DNA binding protein
MHNRTPTARDAAPARTLLQALTPRERSRKLLLTVEQREVPISDAMAPALVEAAKPISEGHAIDVMPAGDEVSAREAADLLKVSRPCLLDLIKKGILPFRMVGAHHRIPAGRVDHLQT